MANFIYKVGESYKNSQYPYRDPNDQFISKINVNRQGIGNSGGIRLIKYQEDQIFETHNLPSAVVLFESTVKTPSTNIWTNEIYPNGDIKYKGDQKFVKKKANSSKGNKMLTSILKYAKSNESSILIPPILFFSSLGGEVTFKGVFKLVNARYDVSTTTITDDHGDHGHIRNFTFYLKKLDIEELNIDWIHNRTLSKKEEDLFENCPIEWLEELKIHNIHKEIFNINKKNLTNFNKQHILFGPPGTGKTFYSKELALELLGDHPLKYKVDVLFSQPDIREKLFETGIGPGKSFYKNFTFINKLMYNFIQQGTDSIVDVYDDKGNEKKTSFINQLFKPAEDLEIINKITSVNYELSELGKELLEEYKKINIESLIEPKSGSKKSKPVSLYSVKKSPYIARKIALDKLRSLSFENLNQYCVILFCGLCFTLANGYIYTYCKQGEKRTKTEQNLQDKYFKVGTTDNDLIKWIVDNMRGLNLLVEIENNIDARYQYVYVLSELGLQILNNINLLKHISQTNDVNYKIKEYYKQSNQKINDIYNRYKSIKEQIQLLTFHPSFEYENFIEGISIDAKTCGSGSFIIKSGILKSLCYKAFKRAIEQYYFEQEKEIDFKVKKSLIENITDWKSCYTEYEKIKQKIDWWKIDNYILIIDEINRADITKVFGECITLLEADKRIGDENEQTVILPYSNDVFGIPKNIYIIGTMNTSDRSIALFDVAMRRRFNFKKLNPNFQLLREVYGLTYKTDDLFYKSLVVLEEINKKLLSNPFIGVGKQIGHGYFIFNNQFDENKILEVWKEQIIPLLEEYFAEDLISLKGILDISQEDLMVIIEGNDLEEINNIIFNIITK